MQIGLYFTLEEMTETGTWLDNDPTMSDIIQLVRLVTLALDPLREEVGEPIRVNSGYRSREVNKEVGGSKTSRHLLGLAADIALASSGPGERQTAIMEAIKALPDWVRFDIDKVIDEPGWVHIQIAPIGHIPRGEIYFAERIGGKMTYKKTGNLF